MVREGGAPTGKEELSVMDGEGSCLCLEGRSGGVSVMVKRGPPGASKAGTG